MRVRKRRVLMLAGPQTHLDQTYYALVEAELIAGANRHCEFCRATLRPAAIAWLRPGCSHLLGGDDVETLQMEWLREIERSDLSE